MAVVSQEVQDAVNFLADCSSKTSSIEDLCEAFDKVRDWSLTDPKRQEELASAGLIRATIKLMICLPGDATLQAKAAGVLWLLARDQQYRAVIEAHGGVLAILDCMKRHKDNARVQSTACGVLWNLAANNESTRVWIALSGGITTILLAMKRHARCAKVQAAGFSVLMNLASDNDPNRDVIISFDGVLLVLLAMRRYPQHPLLQAAGCALLNNLSANSKHVAAVWEAGSVEAILTAMRRHPRHSPVQAYGCAALQNLASDEEYRHHIGQAGGAILVLQAVKHCAREPEVVAYGCAALHNIAFKNAANQSQIVKNNGIEIILKAMRMHERNGKVQANACGALCNILTTRGRRREANYLGVFNTAQRVMDIHVLNGQVQKSASVLLAYAPKVQDEIYGFAEYCTTTADDQWTVVQQQKNGISCMDIFEPTYLDCHEGSMVYLEISK
jgi:Armadillo/beta-catenin-like repeat